MPRAKKNSFKDTQRQFMRVNESGGKVSETVSAKKLGSANRPRRFSKPIACNDFVAMEGSRVVDMGLLQDALAKAHIWSKGI